MECQAIGVKGPSRRRNTGRERRPPAAGCPERSTFGLYPDGGISSSRRNAHCAVRRDGTPTSEYDRLGQMARWSFHSAATWPQPNTPPPPRARSLRWLWQPDAGRIADEKCARFTVRTTGSGPADGISGFDLSALQDLVWVEAEEAPQRGLPQPDSLPPLPSRSSARSSS